MEFKDDIVAISSPPGMGAISLIRVSGPNAIRKTVTFLNLKKQKNLEKEKSHTLHFGEFQSLVCSNKNQTLRGLF